MLSLCWEGGEGLGRHTDRYNAHGGVGVKKTMPLIYYDVSSTGSSVVDVAVAPLVYITLYS